jgi:hypothetical protein
MLPCTNMVLVRVALVVSMVLWVRIGCTQRSPSVLRPPIWQTALWLLVLIVSV